MSTYSFEVRAHSTAPPETVFALLADATSWPRWAGPMIAHGSWEREGNPAPGGIGAIRKVGRAPGFGREEVVAHEPPYHHGYVIVRGQPVHNYRADVYLTPDSNDPNDTPGTGTTITWGAHFEPDFPGTGRILAALFRRIIGGFARRLAAYAETISVPDATSS